MLENCSCCGRKLTDEEKYFYTGQCELCERAKHERIEAWRKGAPDAELDAKYQGVEAGLSINFH